MTSRISSQNFELQYRVDRALRGEEPSAPSYDEVLTSNTLEEISDLTLTSIIKSPAQLIESAFLLAKAWKNQDWDTMERAAFKVITLPFLVMYFTVGVAIGSLWKFFTDALPKIPASFGLVLLAGQHLKELFLSYRQKEFIKEIQGENTVEVLQKLEKKYNRLSERQIEEIKSSGGTTEEKLKKIEKGIRINRQDLAYRVRPWAARIFCTEVGEAIFLARFGHTAKADALLRMIRSQATKKQIIHLWTIVLTTLTVIATALAFFVFPHALVGTVLLWTFTTLISMHVCYYYGYLNTNGDEFSFKRAAFAILPGFCRPKFPPHHLRV